MFQGVVEAENRPCLEWQHAKTKGGYGVMRVKNESLYVHRLSLILKLGRLLTMDEWALHSCDNPSCYEPEHLYAGTPSDNTSDMWDRGRGNRRGTMRGERAPLAKLTWEKVRHIRKMVAEGTRQSELAKHYDMSPSAINAVVKGKTWKE